MKSLRNTVNVLHLSENESKHLPEDPRVQLSNNRSNIFRPGKALQKIKSSSVSVPPLERGRQFPGKDKSYNDRFRKYKKNLSNRCPRKKKFWKILL